MKPRISNFLWGMFFIILGIGFTGDIFNLWHFTIFFAGWWTMFLIIPCFISIVDNGPHTGNVIGLVIGILLFLSRQNILDASFIGKLIFPIILVVIGLSMMFSNTFRSLKGSRHSRDTYRRMEEGNHSYSATFSGQNINCDDEVFEGANLDAIFGSVCLRLDKSIINTDVVINCNATFGGIEIYLPSDVNVKLTSTPVFGGVSNRRRNFMLQNAPTVYINATCMFGGVEIK